MNSYKAAISKLNNNPLKIGSEIVSIKPRDVFNESTLNDSMEKIKTEYQKI